MVIMANSTIKGRIHSFESFGAADGPGIRFIIFMQGCHLKCKYCQNRDTWNYYGGNEYTVEEVIKKAIRCKPYMEASDGGGITVSGGEPLLQLNFVKELFIEARKEGMTTCLDTAGGIYINDDVKQLLAVTDTVLLDIKHIDNEKCIELTGVQNKNTLDFARYLSKNNIDTWIRQVLVPGFTDDEKDLLRLKEFIKTLKSVKKVEILPYHDFGKEKWEKLGFKYEFENIRIPTNDEIEKAKKILDIL